MIGLPRLLVLLPAAFVAGQLFPMDVPCPQSLPLAACFGRSGGSAEDLLDVDLPLLETVEYVQDLLQEAVKVEHSTIPLYLTTLYSIVNQSSFEWAVENLPLFESSDTDLNDAYYYSTDTAQWTSLSTLGQLPSGREGHSASILGERLYIFGGADAYGSLNDVLCLDLATLVWSYPVSAGTPPSPRWGQLGARVSNELLVYGGLSGSSALLSDTWIMSRSCSGRLNLTASRAWSTSWRFWWCRCSW